MKCKYDQKTHCARYNVAIPDSDSPKSWCIFCLRNRAGWRDKMEQYVPNAPPLDFDTEATFQYYREQIREKHNIDVEKQEQEQEKVRRQVQHNMQETAAMSQLMDLGALTPKNIFDIRSEIAKVLPEDSSFSMAVKAYTEKEKDGKCPSCQTRAIIGGLNQALALIFAVSAPIVKNKLKELINEKYPNVTHIPILKESGRVGYSKWEDLDQKQVKQESLLKRILTKFKKS